MGDGATERNEMVEQKWVRWKPVRKKHLRASVSVNMHTGDGICPNNILSVVPHAATTGCIAVVE